jgi:nucleotide-binding universal stress UspA family protein
MEASTTVHLRSVCDGILPGETLWYGRGGAIVYRNILLPTDGLGKCKFGTCHGVILARELGAKLTAVHVTSRLSLREISETYQPDVLWRPSEGKEAKEALAQAEEVKKEVSQKALEIAQEMCAAYNVPCETVRIEGESPVDGILRVAKEKGCDLIFISTHGKPGVMESLFGTIATKVLSLSRIPVLIHHCGGPS